MMMSAGNMIDNDIRLGRAVNGERNRHLRTDTAVPASREVICLYEYPLGTRTMHASSPFNVRWIDGIANPDEALNGGI
jgi:hypothetical protein